MEKFIEMTGKTEDAAIAAALEKLGLDRDDVSVEILERPKSGFLGIGSSPAKIKVTYEAPDEEEAPAPSPEKPEPVKPAGEPAPQTQAAPFVEKVYTPAGPDDEKAAAIVTFLNGLLSHMEVTATPVVSVSQDGSYQVVLEGENLGGIIGRRGETLDAIQQLTSYAVNRGASKRCRIHLDAEGYRAKREEALIRLAQKVAAKVVRFRRNMTLEPMNAYERHVIHTALQDTPNVTTYSTGTEPNRRTVVAYAPGEHTGK